MQSESVNVFADADTDDDVDTDVDQTIKYIRYSNTVYSIVMTESYVMLYVMFAHMSRKQICLSHQKRTFTALNLHQIQFSGYHLRGTKSKLIVFNQYDHLAINQCTAFTRNISDTNDGATTTDMQLVKKVCSL